MTLIIAVICFIAALVLNLILDHKTILEKGTVNHPWHAAIKIASCMPSVYCFFKYLDNVVWPVSLGISLLLVWAYFLILFDGFGNLMRRQHFFYPGSEEGNDDAKTDNFFQSIPIWAGGAIRIGLCLATTFVYYKLSLN